MFYQKSSTKNTIRQQEADTLNRLAPYQESAMPVMRASSPAIGVWVASMMAGNVMTESVT